MIDVSDGLVQDLGHICTESRVGAVVHTARVPLSAGYRKLCGTDPRLALQGGEDYELLCTVPESQGERTTAPAGASGVPDHLHRARLPPAGASGSWMRGGRALRLDRVASITSGV